MTCRQQPKGMHKCNLHVWIRSNDATLTTSAVGVPEHGRGKKQFGPYRGINSIDQDLNKKQFNLTSKSLLNKKQVMYYFVLSCWKQIYEPHYSIQTA